MSRDGTLHMTICCKVPPAVSTRQSHPKRMRMLKKKRRSCFLITRQIMLSTFRCQKQSCCRRWIQGQASAVTRCRSIGHVEYVGFLFLLKVTVHRLIWHGVRPPPPHPPPRHRRRGLADFSQPHLLYNVRSRCRQATTSELMCLSTEGWEEPIGPSHWWEGLITLSH